jgi:hypothetical protein
MIDTTEPREHVAASIKQYRQQFETYASIPKQGRHRESILAEMR